MVRRTDGLAKSDVGRSSPSAGFVPAHAGFLKYRSKEPDGKLFIGRFDETEIHIRDALRLSQRDARAYIWMTTAGAAKLQLGYYEQAASWYRRAIDANRNIPHAHFELGAALAHLGRLSEAHAAVEAGLALNPAFTLSRARDAWTAMSDDPTYLNTLKPILDGLRISGVPKS